MTRKKSFLIGIVVSMALLSACGSLAHKFNPSENGIYIKRDGKLQSALIMDIEGGDYSSDGLREFVQAEVDRYNEKSGEERVSLLEAGVKDGQGKIVYEYISPDALLEFSEFTQDDTIAFDQIQVLDASTSSSISDEEILSKLKGKAKLVVVHGNARITTEGKIVLAKGNQGEIVHDDYDVVTGAGESMIVFK